MKSKYSTKIFPFSGGIQWKIKNKQYIIPEMNMNTWNDFVQPKDSFIFLSHGGGLFETFLSQGLIRSISNIEPEKQVYWSGNLDFWPIVQFTYQATNPDLSIKYPTPIFFDKNNTAYFNCLHNYIWVRSFSKINEYEDNQPLANQIIQNAMFDWDIKNNPKLTINKDKYNDWCKLNNFNDRKPYIVICLETTKHTIHGGMDFLGWDVRHVLHLAGLIQSLGINVVLCAENRLGEVHGRQIYISPNDFNIMLPLIENARAVLSHDIDYLLISLMISKAAIIFKNWSQIQKSPYSISKNADILGSENAIYSEKSLEPYDVYEILANEG